MPLIDMANKSDTYTVRIPHFEGPFDLLLYFIQRDELDIHDIPIAKMTNDFLEYIQHLESLNIDVASEFILVAATLMRIKAKILIPRKEIDEAGNEIDPREELVTKLLEYKRYKEVLNSFEALEEERSLKMERGNALSEVKKLAETALVDVELETIDTYKLFKTFKKVLERYKNIKDKYVHQIVQSPYTVKDQSVYILKALNGKEKVSFEELFGTLENRIHAIVTFLAMLELINSQSIVLTQGQDINDFWLEIKQNVSSEEE